MTWHTTSTAPDLIVLWRCTIVNQPRRHNVYSQEYSSGTALWKNIGKPLALPWWGVSIGKRRVPAVRLFHSHRDKPRPSRTGIHWGGAGVDNWRGINHSQNKLCYTSSKTKCSNVKWQSHKIYKFSFGFLNMEWRVLKLLPYYSQHCQFSINEQDYIFGSQTNMT